MVVCIQKSSLGNQSLAHIGFNLYLLSEINNKKDIRVLITVRNDILNKVSDENWTNLVSHLYFMILNIKKLNLISGESSRKTRVVNL